MDPRSDRGSGDREEAEVQEDSRVSQGSCKVVWGVREVGTGSVVSLSVAINREEEEKR